jgi:CO dehydrogenase/acetyl-CoA synthase beta subunit
MELFAHSIEAVRTFVDSSSPFRTWTESPNYGWPSGGGRNIVLKDDMGLELGSPEKDSVSCLLWTGDMTRIVDGRITLVGPDFPECMGKSLPFSKVVLAGVEGFDEDNAYDRHKDLDFLRYELDLKGFMMRAVSQYMREWCRISTEALSRGFSARTLGSSLIRLFRGMPYVKAVEVIYFTSSMDDVARLRDITAPAEKIIAAMNKMAAEMDFECARCDYQDVCDEAEGLKSMRDKLMKKSEEALHG